MTDQGDQSDQGDQICDQGEQMRYLGTADVQKSVESLMSSEIKLLCKKDLKQQDKDCLSQKAFTMMRQLVPHATTDATVRLLSDDISDTLMDQIQVFISNPKYRPSRTPIIAACPSTPNTASSPQGDSAGASTATASDTTQLHTGGSMSDSEIRRKTHVHLSCTDDCESL